MWVSTVDIDKQASVGSDNPCSNHWNEVNNANV
jgi:hypothetical protein